MLLCHVTATGTEYVIIVDVYGSLNPMTDAPTNLLSNITNILLLNVTGAVISRLPAVELMPLRQYQATAVLPDSGPVLVNLASIA